MPPLNRELAIHVYLREPDSEKGEQIVEFTLSGTDVAITKGQLTRPRQLKLASTLMEIIKDYIRN